jgi:glycosyl transferase family 25
MTIQTDKIFIIHYTKLIDRKKIMDLQLNSINQKFEYIEKFDKETLNEDLINKVYRKSKSHHDEKISALWDIKSNSFRKLMNSEISCALKHFEALNQINKQCSNHGLILEDDAIITNDFINNFNKCLKNTPEDWDIIFLGTGCGDWFIEEKTRQEIPIYENNKIKIFKMPHPATNCAEAYLIKKQAAKKIYESIIPFDLAGDWEIAYQIFKLNLNAYWWTPPLIHQGSKSGQYNSALDEERNLSVQQRQ